MRRTCDFDIFVVSDDEFALLFLAGTDIAFIDEVYANGDTETLDAAFNEIWKRRMKKTDALGIHGTIFYELDEKKMYYPSRRDEGAINPDGSPLR